MTTSRQPKGTPVGGQFAASGRAGADVTLDEAMPAHLAAVAAAASDLADYLGIPAEDVSTDVRPGGCGGSDWYAQLEAAVPDDLLGQRMRVSVDVDRNGTIRNEVRCTVEWPMPTPPWSKDQEWAGSTSADTRAGAAGVAGLSDFFDRTRQQAHMQRVVEQLVNHPQSQVRHNAGAQVYDIVWARVMRAGERPQVRFENLRSSRTRPLTLEFDAASGWLTGGEIDTDYGALPLDERTAANVAVRLEQNLLLSLDEFSKVHSGVSASDLEARFAPVIAAGRNTPRRLDSLDISATNLLHLTPEETGDPTFDPITVTKDEHGHIAHAVVSVDLAGYADWRRDTDDTTAYVEENTEQLTAALGQMGCEGTLRRGEDDMWLMRVHARLRPDDETSAVTTRVHEKFPAVRSMAYGQQTPDARARFFEQLHIAMHSGER